MDPDTYSIGLSSPCSCDNCDTLRCSTRKEEKLNDENDKKLSDACMFFTKVTVKNTRSKTDTATNETIPSKIKSTQETECEICKRIITYERKLDTVFQSACTLINVINTNKSVCESCIRNINKIKQQTNNADLVILDAEPFATNDNREIIEFEACKPKENDTWDIKLENCGQDTLAQHRPTRKSKCKICIREFQTNDNVSDINTDTTLLENFLKRMTTNEKIPNKQSFYHLCKQNYFPPNIEVDTTESNVCKKDIETSEFAEELKKMNKKTSCKFCKRYMDSQDREDDLVCNICKAYFPTKNTTAAGNKKVGSSIFEFCQNFLQSVKTKCTPCKNDTDKVNELNRCKLFNNINETSVDIKDTVKRKCKRCQKYIESNVGRTRCKLCRRHVDSPQETTDSICKICKVYFPSNLYTNLGEKEEKLSHIEHSPKYLKKITIKTSLSIPDSVKRCTRCKKYIESDFRQKRCKYCRRYVDSDKELFEPICKICKSYIPTNSYIDAAKGETLTEKIGTAKFKSNTCKNVLEGWKIEDEKIATITCEGPQTRKIKPINCKVCREDIETKENFITTERTYTGRSKHKVCKRAFQDCETDDSKTALCQNCRINTVGSEIKQRKDKPIFTPTEMKCTGESKSKVCTMCIREFEEAVDKMMRLGKDLKKYNLNTTHCTDCRTDTVSSEIIAPDEICTGKSKCGICWRYVDKWEETMGKNAGNYKKIIPLCEFCRSHPDKKGCSDTVIPNITNKDRKNTKQSKYRDCIGDIEEWETVMANTLSDVNIAITPPDTISSVTSVCQLYRKDNENKVNTEKSKCKLGRRDVEDWQVQFGRISPDTKIYSKSSKNFDSEITTTKHVTKCIKDVKMINHMDTVNNNLTLINKRQNYCCPRDVVGLSNGKKINSYNCKKPECETNVCNTPLHEDIHPSILKLSAQIMNVPYEEFKESIKQQIKDVDKATMKSTVSHDICKRIKEVYKACSCKVCECIIGNTLTASNVCDCKPCDCEDCKSFKYLSHDIYSESKVRKVFPKVSVTKKIQDQPCDCTPCSCIQCTRISTEASTTAKSTCLPPVRTYIAARASENRNADNCTCPACHCDECGRNFFSLSNRVTHEMSTGMMSNCRCEQCVDQRCRGAGGTDECRCDIPSKAIFKPVEKDSHDYGIHRAAVCHQRNRRHDCCGAIAAMYATVSSNFGTVKESCNCEECECVSCKDVNSKLSIKTILKPNQASQMQTIKTSECENLANSKDVGCDCEECGCMNCQSVSKSVIEKLIPLAKPIGKIYYRSNVKECTDCNIPTEYSQDLCEKNQHNVCMKKLLNKNCYDNKDFDDAQKHKYNRNCSLDCKNSTLPKTCSVSQDFAKQIPPQYTAANKYFDYNLKKTFNHTNLRDKGRVFKCSTHCQFENKKCCSKYNQSENAGSSVSTFSSLNQANCDKYNEYGNKMINSQPCQFTLSNYQAHCPKTTFETCLNDILTLDHDFNLKMASQNNKPNISYTTATYDYEKNQDIDDVDVYGDIFEPFSKFHRNFYNKNLNGVQIYGPAQNDFINKCKIKTQSKNCIITSITNCKNNFVKNRIDYARVHNTLKEAKDFSEQLIKLLDKYERANRDFQSVSEKLKLSYESNQCNKLTDAVHFKFDVVAEKQNNIMDNNEPVKRKEHVTDGISDIKISSGSTHYEKNNAYNTQNGIILVKSEQNENYLRNEIILVQKEHESESLKITNSYSNGQYYIKFNNLRENLATTETQIVNIYPRTFEPSLITTNNDVIPEVKTFIEPIEYKSTEQSLCVGNKVAVIEDVTNNNKIGGKGETIQSNIIKEAKVMLPFENDTHNQIDRLTDQLSEIIKENVINHYEKSASSHVNKYDTNIEITDNHDFLSKVKTDGSQGSLNRTNFHLNNLDFYIPPYGLTLFKDNTKVKTYAISVQTIVEESLNKNNKFEKVIKLKSGSSLPRNKTTQVDKESDTRFDYSMAKSKNKKLSGSTLKSGTESDLDTISRFTELSSNQESAIGKAKCSCELLKVGFLGGKRVSDHTVMVKWSRPKDLRNVKGYELLVDGRPVQTIIDSSRCIAVVTCLPNSDRVLLTMKTILLVANKSGHEPSVTIVYHPRLKKHKIDQSI